VGQVFRDLDALQGIGFIIEGLASNTQFTGIKVDHPLILDQDELADRLGRYALELMRTVAPQHIHATRALHADAALLEPPKLSAPFAIEHRHVAQLSAAQFEEEFVRRRRPAMLHGVPEQGHWRALARWGSVDAMCEHYGGMPLRVWEVPSVSGMGKGMPVELPLRHYAEYAREATADSPYYVFQKQFDARHDALRADYAVPPFFADDVYDTTPKIRAQFPLYRYFVVGGPRTGSNMHTDPHFTAAWNALLCGRKRWVLFPPGTPKSVVKSKHLYQPGRDDEPINYFAEVLPRLRTSLPEGVTMFEFTQRAGETVFIPGGWWHAVLNVTDTFAVTQNFASRTNFERVWIKTRTGRKRMAQKWKRELRVHYPDLADAADRLDERDNFVPPPPRRRSSTSPASTPSASSRNMEGVEAEVAPPTPEASPRKSAGKKKKKKRSSASPAAGASAPQGETTQSVQDSAMDPVEASVVPKRVRA